MLDVAGKEYVAKEAGGAGGGGGEEEVEQGAQQEQQQQLIEEEDEEEEVLKMPTPAGDYTDIMKKMDITPCTVIVPKVSQTT
jgi:hypothetical protein